MKLHYYDLNERPIMKHSQFDLYEFRDWIITLIVIALIVAGIFFPRELIDFVRAMIELFSLGGAA